MNDMNDLFNKMLNEISKDGEIPKEKPKEPGKEPPKEDPTSPVKTGCGTYNEIHGESHKDAHLSTKEFIEKYFNPDQAKEVIENAIGEDGLVNCVFVTQDTCLRFIEKKHVSPDLYLALTLDFVALLQRAMVKIITEGMKNPDTLSTMLFRKYKYQKILHGRAMFVEEVV